MSEPKKKGRGGGQLSTTTNAEATARGLVKDTQSARMLRMGEALGNDEMKRRIEMGNASRDELLLYMNKRLGAMREAQMREENFGSEKMRTAWKEISDQHKEDVTKPEPMRWREAAKIYEEAAAQMCRGQLGRGAELMRRAMEAEQKAFDMVSKKIGVKDLCPAEEGGPPQLDDVKPNQACGPRDLPEEVEQKAAKIQANSTEFADQPVKKRVADPWWTLEEEEEEEGQPADAG